MKLLPVTSAENHAAKIIYKYYCKSFTEDERRSDIQYDELFKNPNARIYSVEDLDLNIGYVIFWELPDFIFIEHFEIYSPFRGKKLGSKIISVLEETYPRIILETEPAHTDEIAKLRFSFYKKNGFTLIDETYVQPSYDINKKPVNLWLLANWGVEENISQIKKQVYSTVYS